MFLFDMTNVTFSLIAISNFTGINNEDVVWALTTLNLLHVDIKGFYFNNNTLLSKGFTLIINTLQRVLL